MKTAKATAARFKVGDWVSFLFGASNAFAQVIEYRGPLGFHGMHIYRVRLENDWGEPDLFEMPEDLMAPAPPPDKVAVLNYLKQGGLVAILQSHLIRAKKSPKVWLSYGRRGEVTHTFLAERGALGGAAVPFFALHE